MQEPISKELPITKELPVYEGLPTLALLPAANMKFKQLKELLITIPRSGSYNEINPEVFDEDTGDFNLLHDDVLYVPSITKVLLASGKYPSLLPNQLFVPSIILFNEDDVEIKGSILEVVNGN